MGRVEKCPDDGPTDDPLRLLVVKISICNVFYLVFFWRVFMFGFFAFVRIEAE